MKKEYSIIHSHTDLSSGVTNVDSVTKYGDYIKEIVTNKSLGIKGICFTEHGSTFEWYKKKCECEKNGLKYVHSVEMYVTENLEDKIRDNYHVCLFATNKQSFEELNRLISKASNREDNHFYYVPRITFKELTETSDDILVSTACIGGILGKGNDEIKSKYIEFLTINKNRCYLELQHHLVDAQISYNKYIYELHKSTGIPIVIATDTHALNEKHAKGRTILQRSKGIFFDDESGWDITLKSYDELVKLFKQQKVLSNEDIFIALENTNKIYDKVEEFKVDKSYKYPKSKGDSLQELKDKINAGVIKRGVNKYPNYKSEYIPRIHNELKTYIHNGAVDFLLLDEDIKTEMAKIDIFPGYSRGSCSGSEIAYLIGMTEIDAIEHKMSFERFMNTERVSLAD